MNQENSSLKLNLKESNNKNIKLNETINDINKTISNYKKSNDELKNLLISKEKKIQELEKEPNKLKNTNENLKVTNENIKNKIIERDEFINKLEEQNKKLKNDYNDLIKKYNYLEDKKNKIEHKNIKLDNENKYIKLKLTNLEKINDNSKEETEKMIKELEAIKKNADKSLKYENLKKEDFYDIIIKCNSISGLKKGWEVLMNEKGKKNYYDSKEMRYTKVGVIGSENRGKSTILSDFSQIELPTGTSIKTEGLSIKYPDLEKFKNRKIILLDSAGLETAILNSKDDEIEESSSSNDINKDEMIENGGEDLYDKNKRAEKENKEFANKSRDIIQLELFLQNFIIKYSDILILILGKLSINEQKLLIKVKTHIQNLNRKEPLIVIHNLKEFETKKQVNDYLNNILKNSFTFSLKENEEVNLNEEESEWKNFFEPNSSPKIYHLIYGKKGTEAGNFYNEKSIKFIYNLISSLSDKEKFDPIECVKKYFVEISQTILENPIKEGEIIDNRKLNKENNNANEIKKILLNDSLDQIVLKKCLIDELGISNFRGNGFDAQYSYYTTENNLYVYVELPGKKENHEEDGEYENVEIDKQSEGSYTIIKITGNKKHETKDFIKEKINHCVHKRQFGKFNVIIKLDKLNLDDDYNAKIQNGCLILDFKIKKKSTKRII